MNLICCFWGPRPEARWKRPVLLVISAGLTASIAALLWVCLDRADSGPLYLLGVPMLALSVLGLFVAIWGCATCVARLLGEA